jgi:hypothetical protein
VYAPSKVTPYAVALAHSSKPTQRAIPQLLHFFPCLEELEFRVDIPQHHFNFVGKILKTPHLLIDAIRKNMIPLYDHVTVLLSKSIISNRIYATVRITLCHRDRSREELAKAEDIHAANPSLRYLIQELRSKGIDAGFTNEM